MMRVKLIVKATRATTFDGDEVRIGERIVNVNPDTIRKLFGVVSQDTIGAYLDHLANAEIPSHVEASWEVLDGQPVFPDDQ